MKNKSSRPAHSNISESSPAVEGETRLVGQNEQIQKVCFRINCFFQRNGLCKHMTDVYEKCGWKQTE